MEVKKTQYYFLDEMWNDQQKELNEDEKNITENQLEDNEDEPQV